MKKLEELIALAHNPWDMEPDDSKAMAAALGRLVAIEGASIGEVAKVPARIDGAATADALAKAVMLRPSEAAEQQIYDVACLAIQAHADRVTLAAIVDRQSEHIMNVALGHREEIERLKQEVFDAGAGIIKVRFEANDQHDRANTAEAALAAANKRIAELEGAIEAASPRPHSS